MRYDELIDMGRMSISEQQHMTPKSRGLCSSSPWRGVEDNQDICVINACFRAPDSALCLYKD
jgi:hypothetical protein